MKNYLIVNTALDTFATIGERVLFLPAMLCTSSEEKLMADYLTFDVSENTHAIVCDDITKILSSDNSSSIAWLSFRQLISQYASQTVALLARTIQLARFYQDHHFCSRCGNAVQPHIIDTAMVCPRCDYHQYPRLQPCIITAIVKNEPNTSLKILLAHHNRAKSSGMYGLIAGFVEVGESLENCVHREVKEEVNLQVTNLRYFASQPWPFPSNLMVGFIADYASGEIKIQEEELLHADFFDLDNLPKIPQTGTIAYDLIMAVKEQYQV